MDVRHIDFYDKATALAKVGVWSYDIQTGELFWSDVHKRMWGYDNVQALRYEDWSRPILKEDLIKTLQIVDDVITFKTTYVAEYRIKNIKSQEIRWMRSFGELLYDDDQVVTHLTGVTIDITDEISLKNQLIQSKTILNQILNDLHDGFMLFKSIRDENNVIVDFEWTFTNKKAAEIVGKSPDYLQGKRLLDEMPGNRESGLFDQYVNVVENNQFYTSEFYYNYEGLDLSFESRATKVEDGFGVLFNDITHRVNFVSNLENMVAQRTEDLNRLNNVLMGKNKELQNFNFVSGHHLQEPLRKMAIYLDILKSQSPSPNADTNIEFIEKLSILLSTMTERINAINKMSTIETVVNDKFESVDTDAVVKAIIDQYAKLYPNINIQVDLSTLLPIKSTHWIISMLFENLLINAIEHGNNHTPSFQIKITCHQDDKFVYFKVSDNGHGFDPKFKESVFKMFTSFTSRGQKNHAGVGLALVNKIMKLHNGFVTLETQINQGTTVLLQFNRV